jgi:hypothetical protein
VFEGFVYDVIKEDVQKLTRPLNDVINESNRHTFQ